MLDSEKKRRYLEELEVCVKSMHTWRSCIYGKRKKELVVVFIIVSVKSISQHISIYQSITKKQTNYCGKMWQPGSLHWWLFAELRVYTVGEQVPGVVRWLFRPSIGSCSGDCISSDNIKNWAWQIQNLCGRHDGRLGRRSRRDFLFVFAEIGFMNTWCFCWG